VSDRNWWKWRDPKELAFEMGPQVALVRHWGVAWAPCDRAIVASQLQIDPIGPVSFAGVTPDDAKLSTVAVVDYLTTDITTSRFDSQSLAPFLRYMFERQSPIQVTVQVLGKHMGYPVVATDSPVPIDHFADLTNEGWASGWVLGWEAQPTITFSVSTPLAAPANVSIGFKMWAPMIGASPRARQLVGMTDFAALKILEDEGVLTRAEACTLGLS
jgi:hypothetical protein